MLGIFDYLHSATQEALSKRKRRKDLQAKDVEMAHTLCVQME